jgi:pimeloyl-ACP methyl ester carboxylesterase
VRKVFKWFLIGLGCLLIVAAVAGSVYQTISQSRDLGLFPAPGKLVDVDGHLMHIHCQGQGSPTVVVEQGLGSVSSAWDEIHQQIALETRVCAYDRVGMGYSEPIDHPVRATEVAGLLHKLLGGAGIRDDLVLVGWSAGGVYIREFHRLHPEKVSAMLFVDSSHEQQADRFPQLPESGGDYTLTIARYLAPFGLVRLSGIVNNRFEEFPGSEELRLRQIAIYHQSHILEALLNESDAFELDIHASQPPTPIGDLPLIVLTQGKPVEMPETMRPGITIEYLHEVRKVHNELQLELTALSTRGKQIIATESGHSIHADQPELLIDSVKELVRAVRNEQ